METESGCFFQPRISYPQTRDVAVRLGGMGVGTSPKLFSKMWVLFRELTHDQEKNQIVGFFARASKESSEKSTDTLIQILCLKTVYTSMHSTCIHHRYIQIC